MSEQSLIEEKHKSVEFVVEGEPHGRREQHRILRKKDGRMFVRVFDAKKTKMYKEYVASVAKQHAPDCLLTGPLEVVMRVYRPIPKAWSKKKTNLAEEGLILPDVMPDIDNYHKAIADAITNSGVIWGDDNQIVNTSVLKRYSKKPRVEIFIQEMTQWA